MNFIFSRIWISHLQHQHFAIRCIAAVNVILLILIPLAIGLPAQIKGDSVAEFKRLAAQLSAARLSGAAESEDSQEMALGILDEFAASALTGSVSPDLNAANRRKADLVSHVPPVGENYRLVRLGGNPAAYPMVVHFGLGGPAAIRIYSNASGRYVLAAKIDHFVEKDFFDSDIELVPVSAVRPALLFGPA